MGDQSPRPDEIPDFSLLDGAKPEYVSKRDYIKMNADYRLISNNLLDLSHVNFLHDGLLGNQQANEADIDVRVDGETVRVRRFSENVPVPKVFDLAFRQDGRNVDTWTEIRWDAPGCFMLDAGVTEPGTSENAGTAVIGVHMLTPETEISSHYHFVAVRENPPPRSVDEEIAIRDEVSLLRRMIFQDQDEPMIEQQQARILQSPDNPRPALLGIDEGPIRAERILQSRIDREPVN